MSPENIRDQSYSEKSDVWAFGALLVELISGDEPFPGMSPVECGVWIRDGVATPLNYVPIGVAVPQWVFSLIGRCFTFDASQRPSFNDVVTFLNENVPVGVAIDPNEEAPGIDDGASQRSKKKKNKKNQDIEPDVEPVTVYQDIHAI
jgi:serine/threonine protein kinase